MYSSSSAVIVTCQKCKELYDTTCAYYGEKKRNVGKIIIAANFIHVLCKNMNGMNQNTFGYLHSRLRFPIS